ncbi:MAG: Xaa-Pro peptidase family protein [Actinobacteria bacterium]|nr:Xaa-Pro peptidase family protein [Actinomycetota bacterium]
MPDPTLTAARRDALRRRVRDAGLSALLVTALVNVRYLTGFTGSQARVLVTADGDADVFVTDGRYREQAEAEVPGMERIVNPTPGWLRERLGGRESLGVESQHLPWDDVRDLQRRLGDVTVTPAPEHVEALRQAKDDAELDALRRACRIGDRAFAALVGWVRPGMTEREVAVRLERTMVDLGAAGSSFDTIVASGPNSAIPHHRPAQRRLWSGDLLKVDFGALVDGYHSDMTRTVAIGEPDARLRRVHDVVREAQAAGLAAAVCGAAAAEVDRACRAIIDAAGHREDFTHGTGHGVGLQIHERPLLSPRSVATLADRMAVTVEPGVYLPGVGGVRIEDTVIVGPAGAAGPESLTRSPRGLLVV